MFSSKRSLIVLLAVYLVYSLTTAVHFTGDVKPAAMLPFLILKYHTVYFDGVYSFITNSSSGWGEVYNVVYSNGHYASVYPIVTPVVLLPVYIIHLLCLTFIYNGSIEYYSVLSKSSAALIAAFAAMFFYCVCERLFNQRISVITTVVFAFGTLTWAISSQSLWQHGLSELLFIVVFLLLLKDIDNHDTSNFALIGICAGLFVFNRPSDSLMLLPVVYYLWVNRKDSVYAFLFWFGVSGVPFLFYNIATFWSVFGGYSPIVNSIMLHPISEQVLDSILVFLVSPSRGLFVFSPILIFSFAGVWYCLKSQCKYKIVILLAVAGAVSELLIYSSNLDYMAGGWTYGPRYLTVVLPILALLSGYGISKINKSRLFWGIVAVLLTISIVIEGIGAWYYPYNTWNENYTDHNYTKMWDLNDNIIVNSFLNGSKNVESFTALIWPSLPPPMGYIVIWERGK